MSRLFGAGSDDRVSIAHDSTIDNFNSLTMMAWVRPNTTGADTIIWKGNKLANFKIFQRMVFSTNNIRLRIDRVTTDTDARSSGSPLATDKWSFIAATFNTTAGPQLYAGDLDTEVTETAYAFQEEGSGDIRDNR